MNKTEMRSPKLFTIESSDRDELSGYFSERVSKVAISPVSKASSVTISAAVVPIGSAVAFQTKIPGGARFRQAEDLDGFFLFLPADDGRAIWKVGSKEVVCDHTAGYLGRMNETDTMDCVGQWGHMAVKVPYDQITRTLSHLLDQPIVGALEFDPAVDLTTAPAKALSSMVRLALTPVDGEAFLSTSPVAAAQFSESLTLLLLESFRHTYTDTLSNGAYTLKPKHVKRAIDYMRENAGSALTLQEIAAAAGVSVRALHYGFKKFLGESPFEHLRQVRLEAAYADLTQAPESVSIAEIAKKWGFANPGRFALLCKRCYGHTPSEIRQMKARPKR
ncbi:AraC family transcriptional regulator [Hyphomicrobium sp.]|uniref:AraC family transcriptional regulator n=1 Tax=Hyphomicrobium sp. TaxID=82 RepID=UPI0025C20FF0|nr:AraC family transcriptional regulator [Hyphomicrobium sp.]MCC7251874.1 helix-turn-helix transcriptional regulator [Hyphomicrobium sp.]